MLGTGILSVWHLTREAEACLRESRHCFLIDPGYGVDDYIADLGAEVHNLLGEYHDGENRLDSYRTMAARSSRWRWRSHR